MSATRERDCRLSALRRFALAITVFNLLGHTVLGFEQSWATPLVALATAYACEIFLERVDAWAKNRVPRYSRNGRTVAQWSGFLAFDYLLSAHITGLAVGMLLYANDRLLPIAFATATAIGSKFVLRAPANGGSRHFCNPSNFGIVVTLLFFPWVGIAPPYQFTENLDRVGDWLLPLLIVVSGAFLNWKLTRRHVLIASWLAAFALQAWMRSTLFGTPLVAPLLPMTGLAFVLFTFYMVTDPATTPSKPSGQIAFGIAVAGTYGLLMVSHIVFGLFFALAIVCVGRGALLYASAYTASRAQAKIRVESPALASEA